MALRKLVSSSDAVQLVCDCCVSDSMQICPRAVHGCFRESLPPQTRRPNLTCILHILKGQISPRSKKTRPLSHPRFHLHNKTSPFWVCLRFTGQKAKKLKQKSRQKHWGLADHLILCFQDRAIWSPEPWLQADPSIPSPVCLGPRSRDPGPLWQARCHTFHGGKDGWWLRWNPKRGWGGGGVSGEGGGVGEGEGGGLEGGGGGDWSNDSWAVGVLCATFRINKLIARAQASKATG